MKKALIVCTAVVALALAGCKFTFPASAAEAPACEKGSFVEFMVDVKKNAPQLDLVVMEGTALEKHLAVINAIRVKNGGEPFTDVGVLVWAKLPNGNIAVAHFDTNKCFKEAWELPAEMWFDLQKQAFGPEATPGA